MILTSQQIRAGIDGFLLVATIVVGYFAFESRLSNETTSSYSTRTAIATGFFCLLLSSLICKLGYDRFKEANIARKRRRFAITNILLFLGLLSFWGAAKASSKVLSNYDIHLAITLALFGVALSLGSVLFVNGQCLRRNASERSAEVFVRGVNSVVTNPMIDCAIRCAMQQNRGDRAAVANKRDVEVLLVGQP